MYQLVIADDEKIIRMGLKNAVDWNALGFEVAAVFADGQEIIEYLDYQIPDVILTDIKMSHLSGIDVAKHVFEQKIPCKVVLLSGYQEFDLAVEALRYGVEEYLLKPADVDKMEETFTKLKKQLDEIQKEWQKTKMEKERMDEVTMLLEERFFADLILGGVVNSEEYIRSRIQLLYPEIDMEHSACILADITIQEFETFMDQVWEYSYDQLEINLVNFFRIYNRECYFHIVYKSGGLIEIIGISRGLDHGSEKIRKDPAAVMDGLLRELQQNFHFQAEYEIRCIYDSVLDIGQMNRDTIYNHGKKYDSQIAEQKKLVMSNISVGNIVTAQNLFHNIIREFGDENITERNNVVIDVLSTMNELLKEINGKLSESLQSYFNYSLLASMSRAEEVTVYCDRIFDRIRIAEEKKEYYDTDSLVSKAKQYIQEHIYQDISQEEIANQLFICSSYLSRLFKKQTGETFVQYVTRVKMEKAIELLKDPKYKAYQVGEALGYKTPRYFSRLFRMQTGMNPSEYRGKVLHLGGEFDEN